jgi:hypothetical protein
VLVRQLELAQARVRELESWLTKVAIGTWNDIDTVVSHAQKLKNSG